MSATRIAGVALALVTAAAFAPAGAHDRAREDRAQGGLERDADGCRVVHGDDGVAGAAVSSSGGATASAGSGSASSGTSVHVGGSGVSVSAGGGSVSSGVASSSGGVSVSAGNGSVSIDGAKDGAKDGDDDGWATATGADCVVVVPRNSQE